MVEPLQGARGGAASGGVGSRGGAPWRNSSASVAWGARVFRGVRGVRPLGEGRREGIRRAGGVAVVRRLGEWGVGPGGSGARWGGEPLEARRLGSVARGRCASKGTVLGARRSRPGFWGVAWRRTPKEARHAGACPRGARRFGGVRRGAWWFGGSGGLALGCAALGERGAGSLSLGRAVLGGSVGRGRCFGARRGCGALRKRGGGACPQGVALRGAWRGGPGDSGNAMLRSRQGRSRAPGAGRRAAL